MWRTSQIHNLLKCTYSQCSFARKLIVNDFSKTVIRTSSNICGLQKFNNIAEHGKPNCLQFTPAAHPMITAKEYSTDVTEDAKKNIFQRIMKKLGLDKTKSGLRKTGYILYADITDQVDVMEFFKVCGLPDTFYSYFLVIELHVWMLMVRFMAEGEDGRFLRNCIVDAMWEDTVSKAKKLASGSSSILSDQMDDLVESFQTVLFVYDEGVLHDDKVLASALWRRMFCGVCEDPEKLELVVHYVRRKIAYLDSLSEDELFVQRNIRWGKLIE